MSHLGKVWGCPIYMHAFEELSVTSIGKCTYCRIGKISTTEQQGLEPDSWLVNILGSTKILICQPGTYVCIHRCAPLLFCIAFFYIADTVILISKGMSHYMFVQHLMLTKQLLASVEVGWGPSY